MASKVLHSSENTQWPVSLRRRVCNFVEQSDLFSHVKVVHNFTPFLGSGRDFEPSGCVTNNSVRAKQENCDTVCGE